jgi:prophage regulatory protein
MAKAAFYRINQIIGNPKANPPIDPIIPVCRTSWWNGVKSGKYPQPIKLGLRSTAWRVDDIEKLIESMGKV